MSKVIAVAGPVGSGKTSLVRGLARELGDASTLFYDSYERATERSADAMREWLDRGADPDALEIPGLARDLARLRGGEAVRDPASGNLVEPASRIVFEMPLGRRHTETARFIDLLVWIELPLDLALARKVRQFTGSFLGRRSAGDEREFLAWLDGYLATYVEFVGRVMREQRAAVAADADITVDGRAELPAMIADAASGVRKRLP